MNQLLRWIGLIALGSVTSVAVADESTITFGHDYIATIAGLSLPAKDIGTVGHGATASIIYGHQFSPHYLAEVNLQTSTFETGQDGGTDYYQYGITTDFVAQLYDRRQGKFTPYLLAGLGGVYDDYYPNPHDSAAALVEGGAGLISAPLRNGLRFRAEARYVREFHLGGHSEPRILIGVDLPLGRVEHRVEIRHAPAEVIREVIREPAPPPPPPPVAVVPPPPFRDSDGDGVSDEHDQCPDTPHGLRVDASGCAIAHQSVSLEGVTFRFNDAHLTPEAARVLDRVAKAYRGQPSLQTEIAGHTDSVGNAAANLALSQRRAEAVRDYLILKGAHSEQVTAHGYGKTRLLIDPERTELDGQRNRRVELSILSQ
jgi:OmpA-OmpF porin, OOP family